MCAYTFELSPSRVMHLTRAQGLSILDSAWGPDLPLQWLVLLIKVKASGLITLSNVISCGTCAVHMQNALLQPWKLGHQLTRAGMDMDRAGLARLRRPLLVSTKDRVFQYMQKKSFGSPSS
jgi:hypothetical protein